jgi:cytoskeletal protein RodZ
MAERPISAAGAELRAAREAKGFSRQHIAEITKISSRTLEAVERGDYSRLPGGIFMRSFVRAYAVEVGLNPDAVVRAFLAECPADIGGIPNASPDSIDCPRPRSSLYSLPLGRFAAAAALAMVIVGSAYAYLIRSPADVDHTTADSSQTDAASASPVPTSGASLSIGVTAVAPCWVTVAVDGHTSKVRLLARDESFVLHAEREATVNVGDGAALRLSINGQPSRALGEAGEPATVSVTPDNYRQYLAVR